MVDDNIKSIDVHKELYKNREIKTEAKPKNQNVLKYSGQDDLLNRNKAEKERMQQQNLEQPDANNRSL